MRTHPDASTQPAQVGASAESGEGWVRLNGSCVFAHDANSFAPARLVHQQVHRLNFSPTTEAPVQKQLSLLARIDGPAIVQSAALAFSRTYREAVRWCWALRRAKGLTQADLAREFGFNSQHLSDYINADDKPTRRSLPGELIHLFQEVCGNTFISQWLAARDRLTVLEQMQADNQRSAA